MAIKNKKASLKQSSNQSVDDKLKAKLRESYENFLTEEDEDLEVDETEASDDVSFDDETDMDFSSEDDEATEEDFSEEGEEELSPEENEFFDDQIDLLLEPEVETAELEETVMTEADDEDFSFDDSEEDFSDVDFEDESDIDIESDSDELDFEEDVADEYAEDGFISDEELSDIIDSDNTYEVLGDTMKDITREEVSDEDLEDEIDAEVDIEAELEEAFQNYDQTGNYGQNDPNRPVVNESKKKATAKKAIKEDVSLTSELKDLDFEEEDSELEGSYGSVTKTTAKSTGKVEHGKGLTQKMKSQTMKKEAVIKKMQKESITKSKMLVKAAKDINSLAEKVKQLQLENYKLIKANGILSVAGERIDKDSRKKISESFNKCSSRKQVDTLYEKVVKTIKEKSRPSLNEAVEKVKKTNVKTTNLLKENKEQSKSKLSLEQQRINHLMGLDTEDDVYMSF